MQKTTDVVKEGDKVKVKLLGFDERGKVRLSMKVVDQETGEDLEAKQKAEGEQGARRPCREAARRITPGPSSLERHNIGKKAAARPPLYCAWPQRRVFTEAPARGSRPAAHTETNLAKYRVVKRKPIAPDRGHVLARLDAVCSSVVRATWTRRRSP